MTIRRRRRTRGYILVEALVVIAGLVALMVVLAANQRAALRETQDRLRERRADVAAHAALARALATLQDVDPNTVTLDDDWAALGSNGSDAFTLGTDGATTFRVQIVDAGSMLNLNTATEEQLNLLPIEQEQIDGLLDWRDATGGAQARPDGAKDEYYNGLDEPYNAKLGRLTTLDELLLVKGWTARTLYAPLDNTITTGSSTLPEDINGNLLPLAAMLTVDSGASNTQTDGSARLNLGAGGLNGAALTALGIDGNTAALIVANGPYTSFQNLLSTPGLSQQAITQLLNAAAFTADTRVEGKINLNTATQAVLETLPNMTAEIADEIVSRQSSGGFASLGDLATIPGLTNGAALAPFADSVTVGSDTWIVRAYGESGGVGVAVEAVVRWNEELARPQVITWNRLNTPGIPVWWGWEAEPTTTLEAGAIQ